MNAHSPLDIALTDMATRHTRVVVVALYGQEGALFLFCVRCVCPVSSLCCFPL